jgi:hypothetical protein
MSKHLLREDAQFSVRQAVPHPEKHSARYNRFKSKDLQLSLTMIFHRLSTMLPALCGWRIAKVASRDTLPFRNFPTCEVSKRPHFFPNIYAPA